jgi:hypothetical protein
VAFVQIIEFQTTNVDEMRRVAEQWEKATESKRSAVWRILCQDRDEPGNCLSIAFFESYDLAMQSSSLPETDKFSREMYWLVDGAPAFHNMNVVKDRI